MYDIIELNAKKVLELKEIAKKLGISRLEKLKKQDLVYSILDEQALRPGENKKAPAKSKAKSAPARPKKDAAESSKEEKSAPKTRQPRPKKNEAGDSKESSTEEQSGPSGKRQPGDAIRERRAKQNAKNEQM